MSIKNLENIEEIEIIGDFEGQSNSQLNYQNNLKSKNTIFKVNRYCPIEKMNNQASTSTAQSAAPANVALIPISDREIQMLLGTIPEFYPGGNLSLFIQKVDKLLCYLGGRLTPTQTYIVQDTIQLKIKGEAETYIACLNISNWDEMKNALLRKYGDQRSEEILANELRKVTQFRNETYTDFYSKIIIAFNALIEHLLLHTADPDLFTIKRNNYTSLAMNTFKYGILEPYRSYLKYFNFNTLEEGLQHCHNYDNEILQEEYHEFIRDKAQKKLSVKPTQIYQHHQNRPTNFNIPNFQTKNFPTNQSQTAFHSQNVFNRVNSHINQHQPKPFSGNINKPLPQPSKPPTGKQVFGRSNPNPNWPHDQSTPMSTQSRVPTQQYHNRFRKPNHFQSTGKPQFAVQELFNVESNEIPKQSYNNIRKNNQHFEEEIENNETQDFQNILRHQHPT